MFRTFRPKRFKDFRQSLAKLFGITRTLQDTSGTRLPPLLIYSLIFLILQLIFIAFLAQQKKMDQESYLKQIIAQEKTSQNATLVTFRKQAYFLFRLYINRPEILSLLKKASESGSEERDKLRSELYKQLDPMYNQTKKEFFPQIHFHFADGTSFLRMHRPEVFGDDLFTVRKSIKIISQKNQFQEGFEVGRHTEAFRFIFPLPHEARDIGSVEFSVPPSLFRETLSTLFQDEYRFILKKNQADRALLADIQKKRLPAALSNDFYQERDSEHFHSELHESHLPPELITAIDQKLHGTVEASLRQEALFARIIKMGDNYYIITFLPILDLEQQVTGYRISYRQDQHLALSRPHFILFYLIGTGLMLLTLILQGYFSKAQRNRLLFQQKILNAIPTPIFHKSTQGYFFGANTAFFNLTTILPEQLPGKTAIEVFPALPPAVMSDLDQQAISSGQIVEREVHLRDEKGTQLCLILNETMITTEEPDTSGAIIGAVIDITERKKAEDITQNALLEMDQIFNTAADGMWVINTDFTCQMVNDTLLSMLHQHRDNVLYKRCFEIFPGTQCHTHQCPMIRIKNGEGRIEAEEAKLRKNGDNFFVLRTATPFRDWDGKLLGIVENFKDITERLQSLTALSAAKDAAEAANQAKSNFLANMSHEVRTPLNGILGMTTLTLGTELTEKQQQYLGMMKKSGERLLVILNQILDFSKLESGKLEIELIPFALRDLLNEVFTPFAIQLNEMGITSTLFVAQDIPNHWQGDAGRLRQILTNLLDNAKKFTAQGSISLRVEIADQSDEKTTLHFSVQDTGIGIPADKQQLVFAPFKQADSSLTRKYGGTGLGLSISKQLIDIMEGTIWLESEEGKGTTVHFSLPFHQMPRVIEPNTVIPIERLTQVRVLVIQDTSPPLLSLAQIPPNSFQETESIPLPASWPPELKHPSYELLILAMDEDCLSLIEKIRKDERFRNTPIIFIAPSGFRGDALRYRQLGVDAYLTGNISSDQLLTTIRMVLAQPTSPQASAELITRHTLRETENVPHILVVDDDFVNRVLDEEMLKIAGWRVSVAENGEQALALLKKEHIDLLLMDMQMPIMDGYTAMEKIREKEQQTGGHLPIIALTGFAFAEDRDKCLASGADDYLSKPFKPEELMATVRQHLQQGKEANNA